MLCSTRNVHPNTLKTIPWSCLGEMATLHAYYTQVQGQLLITERQFYDFVMWTSKGTVLQ